MKSVFFQRSSRTSVDSVMTPMIDVVFLLLIFFLASASFQRLEKSLPSSVAAEPVPNSQGDLAETPPPETLTDLSDIVIRIQSGDANQPGSGLVYVFNEEPMASYEALALRLVTVLKVRSDIPIIIDPDNTIPAGEPIRVYDLAKANGSVAVYLVAK